MNPIVPTTVAGALALALSLPAYTQTQQERIDLTTWDQASLYQGWLAENLLDMEVYGQNGEDIGDVENLIVNNDGHIEHVIIEVGGFLDIGDRHLRIPWNQVTLRPDGEGINVPLTEEGVDEFSLFDDDDAAERTGPRSWRVTELMNDYVRLQGGDNYGIVDDLIFDRNGQLQAVVVQPDVTFGAAGPYAYPYYRSGYDPGLDSYQLPYNRSEISKLEPFDYSSLRRDILNRGVLDSTDVN